MTISPTRPRTTARRNAAAPNAAYRQLTGDLKRVRARVETLEQKNRQLQQQNRLLQEYLGRFVQASQYLQQASAEVRSVGSDRAGRQPDLPPFAIAPTHAEIRATRRPSRNRNVEGTSVWVVVILMVAIVASFTGLGYAIVRPLMPPQR
ncbi:hypothetical protein [Rubidibacter lacunae]|nr:hypothetical protein [Rubidibacter lacunae]